MNNTQKTISLSRVERRLRVAEMYLKGETQTAISEALGVTQATVSRDITYLHDEWVRSSILTINEAKARELQRIDHLERVYWEQYQASKTPARRTTNKGVRRNANDPSTNLSQTVTVIEQIGDPRLLDGIKWCIEQRCKLFGLYQSKLELSWRDTVRPDEVAVVNGFFEEATRALADKLVIEAKPDDDDDISL